ncbi:unnamed protein product [Peniophora sp. CBMAI 1063]|nr:unnamed protein product [Peniophora sp. CBMAI 1063]
MPDSLAPGFREAALVGMAEDLGDYLRNGGGLNIDGGAYVGPGQAPEEYHQTGAARPRQTKKMPADPNYTPYVDRVAAVLDVCRHLPRSVFSDSQMETINWCCTTLGIDSIPSVSWLKEMSDDLQDKIGIRTLRFQGALGHVYYANSLQDQIAQEFANPLISEHIRVFPEDIEPSAGMGEARQFARWRHEADPSILSPMPRVKNPHTGASNDFLIFEPVRLSDASASEICMPFRFFTREVTTDVGSRAEFFVEAWRLEAVIGDRPEHGGYIVNEHSVLEFPASHLQLTFPMLQATHKTLSVPDPGSILGRRNELHGEVTPWTRVANPVLDNNWRAKARQHRVVTFMMWLYCDDTSGNSSKKWNKHNSFLWTAAGLPRAMAQQQQNVHFSCTSNLAPPLEMLDGIASQLEEGQRDGWWVWDYANNEPVLVIPEVLALLGDNPMQSELSCHIGLMGKYFCRICKVRGSDADDDDDGPNAGSAPQSLFHHSTHRRRPLLSLDASSLDSSLTGSSTDASSASTSGISGSSAASDTATAKKKKPRKRPLETMHQMYDRSIRFLSNNPFRRKEESQDQLRSIFTEASRVGGKTNAGKMQTQHGVKDTYQSTFMEKIWDFGRKLRGSIPEKQQKMDDFIRNNIPEEHISPVWRIQDLDPHKDTPGEVLHVVLLGFVKYFWRDIVSRLSDEEKATLATRLSSFDFDLFTRDGQPCAFDNERVERLTNYAILCSNNMGLTEGQLNDILILIKLSCGDIAMSYGQMYWNIFSAAHDLHSKNTQQKLVFEKEAIDALVKTVLERLREAYELSRDQNLIILNRAKQLIGEAQRINYKNTALEIEAKLRQHEKFAHVWGNDIPEIVVRSACKEKAKNLTGSLRLVLYKTLVGKQQCSLATATLNIVTTYCSLPADQKIPIQYQVHFALLRRFIREKAWGDWVIEYVNDDGEKIATKCKGPSGRVPTGEDFWSKVEAWFLERLQTLGEGFKGTKWEEYIKETIRLDHEKYFAGQDPALESFPEEYYHSTIRAREGTLA